MLNISDNSIGDQMSLEQFGEFKACRQIKKSSIRRLDVLLLLGLLVILLGALFLPWTQNIAAKGYVTTRQPEQRPQAIQSVISGRLEQWYVQEGDFVKAGDTIVHISEVKSEYFDPELIARTGEQVDAKQQSIGAYDSKIMALENQYAALGQSMRLKTEQTRNKILQTRNKISMDSLDLVAYRANLKIAENQVERTRELYGKDLKTLTELQEKELKLQQTQAKVTVQENKVENQRNELVNLGIELTAIAQEYADKMAKSLSDKQSAMSARLEAVAATSKLSSQLSNYNQRQRFYHITAPQAGYITKTIQKGIGEIVKEGTDIATVMPSQYDLAVEMYVRPQDMPLLQVGKQVRFRFDGWPAIVISGWPKASTGVFSGNIVAIDQFISDNGYYRIMASPDGSPKEWPPQLRVGTGADAFIILKDVPVWYELWRQLNGFPPDYYQTKDQEKQELKRKAPLKSVK